VIQYDTSDNGYTRAARGDRKSLLAHLATMITLGGCISRLHLAVSRAYSIIFSN